MLRAALDTLSGGPVRLVVAGRTDAGVHARGQVAHADVGGVVDRIDVRRLNGLLPDEVRVSRVGVAASGFDARYSALSRWYGYRVADRGTDPLRRHDTLHWPRPLSVDQLNAASTPLLGLQEFAAFCRRRDGGTTVRHLLSLDWARDADAVVVATVEADAFCHSMVRSLVGALLAVGDGRKDPAWPASLLGGAKRADAVPVAPAHGLTLLGVRYPADDQLGQRAVQTRARRSVDQHCAGHADRPPA